MTASLFRPLLSAISASATVLLDSRTWRTVEGGPRRHLMFFGRIQKHLEQLKVPADFREEERKEGGGPACSAQHLSTRTLPDLQRCATNPTKRWWEQGGAPGPSHESPTSASTAALHPTSAACLFYEAAVVFIMEQSGLSAPGPRPNSCTGENKQRRPAAWLCSGSQGSGHSGEP